MDYAYVDEALLIENYPPPEKSLPDRPWVRSNFASALNGVIAVNGKSEGVSGPPDKDVFRFLRRNCDAILVGASTALSESYATPKPDPLTGKRPLLVVASNSLDIPADAKFLDEQDQPVIVTTSQAVASNGALLDRLSGRARIAQMGDTGVSMEKMLQSLSAEGIGLLLCEGGPTLFSALVSAGVADELCLTLSPRLAPGTPTGFVKLDKSEAHEMTLASSFSVQNYLFCRYLL